MTQLESRLSRNFINKLRQEVSCNKDKIKIVKIHGGPYQTLGISDYLVWYKGKGVAIEFKVFPNTLGNADAQHEFLMDIAKTGNVAICVTFNKDMTRDYSPLNLIERVLLNATNGPQIHHLSIKYA
jgi:hypothetical protein